jgi:hypothetical protein
MEKSNERRDGGSIEKCYVGIGFVAQMNENNWMQMDVHCETQTRW